MNNLAAVLAVQIPALVAAGVAIWRAVTAEASLKAHVERMKTGTPFQPSELEMIGHAARSMAKDFLQTVEEKMTPATAAAIVTDVVDGKFIQVGSIVGLDAAGKAAFAELIKTTEARMAATETLLEEKTDEPHA